MCDTQATVRGFFAISLFFFLFSNNQKECRLTRIAIHIEYRRNGWAFVGENDNSVWCDTFITQKKNATLTELDHTNARTRSYARNGCGQLSRDLLARRNANAASDSRRSSKGRASVRDELVETVETVETGGICATLFPAEEFGFFFIMENLFN